MPKYSQGSLSSDLEPIMGEDNWNTTLVDPGSEHSGAWSGGMISVHRVVRDFDGLLSGTYDIDLMDVPVGANWKFWVMGAAVWADVTHNGATLDVDVGENSPLYSNILGTFSIVTLNKEFWGRYIGEYNFLRGRMVDTGDSIKAHWVTDASSISGAVTFSVWGCLIPDILVAGS